MINTQTQNKWLLRFAWENIYRLKVFPTTIALKGIHYAMSKWNYLRTIALLRTSLHLYTGDWTIQIAWTRNKNMFNSIHKFTLWCTWKEPAAHNRRFNANLGHNNNEVTHQQWHNPKKHELCFNNIDRQKDELKSSEPRLIQIEWRTKNRFLKLLPSLIFCRAAIRDFLLVLSNHCHKVGE